MREAAEHVGLGLVAWCSMLGFIGHALCGKAGMSEPDRQVMLPLLPAHPAPPAPAPASGPAPAPAWNGFQDICHQLIAQGGRAAAGGRPGFMAAALWAWAWLPRRLCRGCGSGCGGCGGGVSSQGSQDSCQRLLRSQSWRAVKSLQRHSHVSTAWDLHMYRQNLRMARVSCTTPCARAVSHPARSSRAGPAHPATAQGCRLGCDHDARPRAGVHDAPAAQLLGAGREQALGLLWRALGSRWCRSLRTCARAAHCQGAHAHAWCSLHLRMRCRAEGAAAASEGDQRLLCAALSAVERQLCSSSCCEGACLSGL